MGDIGRILLTKVMKNVDAVGSCLARTLAMLAGFSENCLTELMRPDESVTTKKVCYSNQALMPSRRQEKLTMTRKTK